MLAGLSDAVHFGFLFGLVLCMYGVWAHFMFGTQAPDWVDITTSIVSVFRCVMYDYDMVVMETQYRAMADFFYCTFMILVTVRSCCVCTGLRTTLWRKQFAPHATDQFVYCCTCRTSSCGCS